MKTKTLITTSIEETWPQDNSPVVFIGEWCRLYSRKDRWSLMNYEVVPYHWNDRVKLINDYSYLITLQEKIVENLSIKLNEIHNVNFNNKFWEILIGNWVGYFSQIIYDRWYMLKLSTEQGDKLYKNLLTNNTKDFIPIDFDHFQEYFISDEWNEYIYNEIIKFSFPNNFIATSSSINIEMLSASNIFSIKKLKITSLFYLLSTKIYRYLIHNVIKRLQSNGNYFFLNTYLPLFEKFKIQILLCQFPQKWHKEKIKITTKNSQHRNFILDIGEGSDFEKVLGYLIFKQIPKVFLEGFKEFDKKIDKLYWPQKPKAIFTSNSYSSDDVFNYYAGRKVIEGSKLIIGQHGGHFGTNTFSFPEDHQLKISDKFISWGWSDEKKKNIVPFGNFKDIKRKKINSISSGNVLLVLTCFPRYSYCLYSCPISSQYLSYLEDQFSFLRNLKEEIRNKLIIRLYPNDYKWFVKDRFNDLNLSLMFDNGINNINKLMNQSRVYIATYNATTFLETFTLNFPTIIFWNPAHWELNKDANELFSLLEDCGIFHRNPESAALKLIEIWENVDEWWQSKEVRYALKLFCNKFCKQPEKFTSSFVDLIIS